MTTMFSFLVGLFIGEIVGLITGAVLSSAGGARMMIKICPVCNGPFEVSGRTMKKVYCSLRCKSKHNRERIKELEAEQGLKEDRIARNAAMARELGMTYGMYVAFKEGRLN